MQIDKISEYVMPAGYRRIEDHEFLPDDYEIFGVDEYETPVWCAGPEENIGKPKYTLGFYGGTIKPFLARTKLSKYEVLAQRKHRQDREWEDAMQRLEIEDAAHPLPGRNPEKIGAGLLLSGYQIQQSGPIHAGSKHYDAAHHRWDLVSASRSSSGVGSALPMTWTVIEPIPESTKDSTKESTDAPRARSPYKATDVTHTINAVITGPDLYLKDGYLRARLNFELGSGGKGFRIYTLSRPDGARPDESPIPSTKLARLLEVCGVRSWSQLPGRSVRIITSGVVSAIGHIVEDIWLESK